MIIVADTSALIAVFSVRDPRHSRCADLFESTGGFVYSPLVSTELDHLLRIEFTTRWPSRPMRRYSIESRVPGPLRRLSPLPGGDSSFDRFSILPTDL
ncbi:hypothetical protein QWI33_11610 [Glycomyces tritici]|uniref:PIN domain-containing protein n=1 Tax=Glycomyces tritici TaxID=2665176 RepID=A0ABT7YP10_9ACTN|nr:hypothetical protein [Glycomyces tritici]